MSDTVVYKDQTFSLLDRPCNSYDTSPFRIGRGVDEYGDFYDIRWRTLPAWTAAFQARTAGTATEEQLVFLTDPKNACDWNVVDAVSRRKRIYE